MGSSAHKSPPSAAHERRPRILAIDYGRRRIGMAISDELGRTARPLAVFLRKNRRDDLRRLRAVIREHDVGLILVGLPLQLDGRGGEMAAEASRFAARVGKELGLTVQMRDERLTSWAAEELTSETRRPKRKKASMDSIAAAILLREHLEEKQSRSTRSEA